MDHTIPYLILSVTAHVFAQVTLNIKNLRNYMKRHVFGIILTRFSLSHPWKFGCNVVPMSSWTDFLAYGYLSPQMPCLSPRNDRRRSLNPVMKALFLGGGWHCRGLGPLDSHDQKEIYPKNPGLSWDVPRIGSWDSYHSGGKRLDQKSIGIWNVTIGISNQHTLGCPPIPGCNRGKWRFIGIPYYKYETILVGTVTRQGDKPNHTYLTLEILPTVGTQQKG